MGRRGGGADMIIKLVAHHVIMASSKGLKTPATAKHYTRVAMPSSIIHSIVKPLPDSTKRGPARQDSDKSSHEMPATCQHAPERASNPPGSRKGLA